MKRKLVSLVLATAMITSSMVAMLYSRLMTQQQRKQLREER